MTEPDVLIIGADTEGLAAAVALTMAGQQVMVVDPAPSPGGAASPVDLSAGIAAPLIADDEIRLDADFVKLMSQCGVTPALRQPGGFVAMDGTGRRLYLPGNQADMVIALLEQIPEDVDGFQALCARLDRARLLLGRMTQEGSTEAEGERASDPRSRTLEQWIWESAYLADAPLQDLLDRYIDNDLLKIALAGHALAGAPVGPKAAGSGLHLLRRWPMREPVVPVGGSAALCRRLIKFVEARGGTVLLGTEIVRTSIKNNRITKVTFNDRRQVAPKTVISSLDPKRSILTLFDWKDLPGGMADGAARLRSRGHVAKLVIGLDDKSALSRALKLEPTEPLPTLIIAPSLNVMEQAYDMWRRRMPHDCGWIQMHATFQDLLVITIPFTVDVPLDGAWTEVMRQNLESRALQTLDRAVPELSAHFRGRRLLLPQDLESALGVTGGALDGLDATAAQVLWDSPTADFPGWRMPLRNFALCGGSQSLRRTLGARGLDVAHETPNTAKRRAG